MAEIIECTLCGLPTPPDPITGGGHRFCCVGCREVFLRFGNDILTARPHPASGATESEIRGAEAFLRIDGMHCASCEMLIGHLARRIDGIHTISSSYATATARVDYDPEKIAEADLPHLLSTAGYRISLRNGERPAADQVRALFRVVVATSLAAVVMMLYLAFYYPTHLGLVDYADLAPVGWLAFRAVPLAMFILTTIMVAYVGLPIFRGAWVGLRIGVLNMDNLLSIAILAAWAYSSLQYLEGSTDFYFDVTAMILTVVTVGRYFERGARAGATAELERLLDAWATVARVRRGGRVQTVSLKELQPGETLIIEPAEAIAVDGVILSGSAAVDESLMTGEPFPIRAEVGDRVRGGTIVVEGRIEVAADPALQSQMDALARILWKVQSGSAGLQGFADRLARGFVPLVLVLAVAISMWKYTGGASLGTAMQIGLATLIVSCPCTFGLAIPLASAAGIGAALKHGIILTSANIFDKPRVFDTVVFDKTGTLSSGDMVVDKVIGPPPTAALAAAAERLSSHPIADAIGRIDHTLAADDAEIQAGRGVIASVRGKRVAVGSGGLFRHLGWNIPPEIRQLAEKGTSGESVASYVGWDGGVHGVILTRDASRPEWRGVVANMRHNSHMVLLSGAEKTSSYQADFDETHSGVPPAAKAAIVRHLRSKGTVLMIGDGSNDAPALAEADLGIAFGAPTALAAEAADVVIPGDDLGKVALTLSIIATTHSRIRQNLGWALLYNATAIPLALSGYLNPLFAALAMSTSSLLVVWNSSRSIGPKKAIPQGDDPLPLRPERAGIKLARR